MKSKEKQEPVPVPKKEQSPKKIRAPTQIQTKEIIASKNLIPKTKLNTEGSANRVSMGRDRGEGY